MAAIFPALFAVMLALSGCVGSTPVREEPFAEQDLPEVQPTDELLDILRGEGDTQD